MALTATFAADFSAFSKSIASATVQLGVFDRGAKSASRDLKREMESISGQKVAAEAARMAEAVRRLGGEGGAAAGLLKLTDQELSRLQSTMDAATAKANKLGEALPESLKQVNEQLAKLPAPLDAANQGTGLLDASFAKLTSSFAAAAVVDKVVSGLVGMAAAAVQGAGDLVDLSGATGVSIGKLQQWAEVAKGGGLQLEDMTTASFKLGAAIAGGSQSVTEAVGRLGLSFASIKQMKPEDQMDLILRAADKLGPVQERNAVLVDLFGARGAAALARIVDGYTGVADGAEGAAEAQIRSLDKASEAWDRAKARSVSALQAILGNLALLSEGKTTGLGTGIADLTAQEEQMIGFLKKSGGDLDAYVKGLQKVRAERAAAASDGAAAAPVVATRDYSTELANLKKTIDGLLPSQRAQLDAAIAIGASAKEIEANFHLSEEAQRLYAGSVRETAAELTKGQKAVDAYGQSLRNMGGQTALADTEKAMQQLQDLGGIANVLPSQLDELRKRFEAGAEAAMHLGDSELATFYKNVAAQLTPVAQLQDRYNVKVGEYVPMGASAAEVSGEVADQLARVGGEVVRIGPGLAKVTGHWIAYREAVKSVTPEQIKQAGASEEQLQAAMKLADAFRQLSSSLADLAQVGDGKLGGIATTVSSMAVGATAGMQMASAMAEISANGAAAAGSYVKLASAAVAAAAAMAQATSSSDRTKNILAGAGTGAMTGGMAGAQIGTMVNPGAGTIVGGVIGAVGGALIGGIVGSLRKREMQDVLHRVGRDWGIAISDGMAESIAADAKNLFGGDRQAAEIFNLNDIIGEAGGISGDNFKTLLGKLHDALSMYETGMFTAAQATRVLDQTWRQFVEAGTDGAGRLRPELVEMIRLTKELGIVSKEVQAYLREQASAAISGSNAVINASRQQFESYQKIADSVKEAQAEIDRLNAVEARGRGVEWTRDMEKAQAKLTEALGAQHKAGEGAAGQLETLGRIAMGTYAAAIKGGMSHNEAMKAAAPGLIQLIKAYENLGISVEDAGLKAFLAQAKFVEANPEILAGIDGLTQSMIAMSNMGLLDADMFAKLQQSGQQMYEQLLAKAQEFGLSGDEATRAALVPMQEYLRQAAEQAELLGVPLDENTQKLIDQSKAMGLWKDKAKDPMVEMTDAVKDMRDAVKELVNELKKMPGNVTTTVKTRYIRENTDDTPMEDPGPTPGPSSRSAASAGGGPGGGATITVPVSIDGRQVAQATVPYIPGALRRRGV